MIEPLEEYSWQQVFNYASPDAAIPTNKKISCAPFSASDVAKIYAYQDGSPDGDNWVMYGKLNDGRYFSIRAWCDYTGWG